MESRDLTPMRAENYYGLIVALLYLGPVLVSPACASVYVPPASDSSTLNFNPGWRFAPGRHPVSGGDDSGWQAVATPHTYHESVGYQGLKKGLRDLRPHTYRKHFKVPAEYANLTVLLEFEGIRQRGQFYLNGHRLGRHQTGCTPFGFDITPYLKFGDQENVLHVEMGDRGFRMVMLW
jgi:beta-galactosidase